MKQNNKVKIKRIGKGEMYMKKKLSVLMMILVVTTMLVGCGIKENNKAEKIESNSMQTPKEKVNLQVFIAASLKNAMTEIQAQYQVLHPEVEINFNVDSSGTLQKQIEEGASCDVFFSAAMKQMNALVEGRYVIPNSVIELLENKVVLIKPKEGKTEVTGFEDIMKATNLALAGQDVPVGAYAREVFTSLGILDQVMAMEINEGANVTAVLSAVSEGSNEVGIVYGTDANSVKELVEIIAEAPNGSLAKPVTYPVGLINNEEASEIESAAAKEFVDYLQTEEALNVFKAYGFEQYNG